MSSSNMCGVRLMELFRALASDRLGRTLLSSTNPSLLKTDQNAHLLYG